MGVFKKFADRQKRNMVHKLHDGKPRGRTTRERIKPKTHEAEAEAETRNFGFEVT